MQGQNEKSNPSGNVRFDDGKISWEINGESVFQIDIDDIVVIGEFTNSDGPYFDDWFLTFVTKNGHWQSIPWHANNIDHLTTILTKQFQQDFDGSYLNGSTQWASVVRHPIHLKGKELFKLTMTEDYKNPKTIIQTLLHSVGFGNFDTTQYIKLTEEVTLELTNASR